MNEQDWHREQRDEEAALLIDANLRAVFDLYGVDTVARLARAIYKTTDCGAWLSVKRHDGKWIHSGDLDAVFAGDVRLLRVGSTVEGSDAEFAGCPIDLLTDDDVVSRIQEDLEWIDEEVECAWRKANSEDEEDEGDE